MTNQSEKPDDFTVSIGSVISDAPRPHVDSIPRSSLRKFSHPFQAAVEAHFEVHKDKADEACYGRQRRLVGKHGECRIKHANVFRMTRRFLADIYTTMMDVKWRFVLLFFFLVFTGSWTIFGGIWWLICFIHGDFHNNGVRPCVENVKSFEACILFSIETQHTIGYGSRYLTEECPEAIVIMMLQSILGVMMQCCLLGLVLAKIAKSKKRQKTLIFSSKAVVTIRDNWYCLLFRVGDIRSSHIIQAHVRALCIKKRIFKEGEVMPFHHYDVNVGFDKGMDRLFLTYPHTVCHVINELSPFYDLALDDLKREHFELVVILEGGVEHTGVSVQARTSYVPSEIAWGFAFPNITEAKGDTGEFRVDYSKFHSIHYVVNMPRCSAREFYAKLKHDLCHSPSSLSVRNRRPLEVTPSTTSRTYHQNSNKNNKNSRKKRKQKSNDHELMEMTGHSNRRKSKYAMQV